MESARAQAAGLGTDRSELIRRGARAVLRLRSMLKASQRPIDSFAPRMNVSPPIPASFDPHDDSLVKPRLRGSSQRHLLGVGIGAGIGAAADATSSRS